jgi:hypothetical protein
LLINPCSSIHTHFMSFPIDVVCVDKDLQILAIDAEIAPWRFGKMRRGVRFVIELSAGGAAAAGPEVSDQQEVEGYEPLGAVPLRFVIARTCQRPWTDQLSEGWSVVWGRG